MRLGLFQGIGDHTEQIHMRSERSGRGTLVFVEGQPHRPIDKGSGTVHVVVVECAPRLDR